MQREMEQKALIILGMHRSGTSAVSRVVNLLGVDLGKTMLEPNDSNERGYWEHKDIYLIHERLLSLIGRKWSDVLPYPEEWWKRVEIKPIEQEIADILRHDFGSSPLWGVKDPRLPRLLPLWLQILAELGSRPHFLHVIRNPLEVAASLERRDGFRYYKSVHLWFRHVCEAEAFTRDLPRAFVTYDQLLENWSVNMARVSQELGLSWPNRAKDVIYQVDDFILDTLRHQNLNHTDLEQRTDVPSFVIEAYRALNEAAHGNKGELSNILNNCVSEFNRSMTHFFPLFSVACEPPFDEQERTDLHKLLMENSKQLAYKDQQLAIKDQQLAIKDQQLKHCEAQLRSIQSSLLWRSISRLRKMMQ